MSKLCWTQHSNDYATQASNEVNISRKPPPFLNMFPIYNYSWKWHFQLFLKIVIYFFQLQTTRIEKYKLKMKL